MIYCYWPTSFLIQPPTPHGLFPCPSEKTKNKKKTIIRLTEMSEILRIEKFPEDANTISTFSLPW